MTGNNFLLDTNIIIEIFDGNKDFAKIIAEVPEFYISSIVLGELYVGINRVSNKVRHVKKLHEFLKLCTVLDANDETAIHYGAIVARLYKKGRPIPTNDVWIASVALQHELTVVTMDKHFSQIEGLKLELW